jgi:hypothetical protein
VAKVKFPEWVTAVYRRDEWVCKYCKLDGTDKFAAWRSLSMDHLLPHGHPQRDAQEFIVTSCAPCNAMLNQYFTHAKATGETYDSPDRERLLNARREFLSPRVDESRTYWQKNVARGRERHPE